MKGIFKYIISKVIFLEFCGLKRTDSAAPLVYIYYWGGILALASMALMLKLIV